MRRNCLIPAVLVFVLVASGCGGGNDGDPSGSGDDTLPEVFTTADSGSDDSPEDSPEIPSGADATPDDEQMDSTAPDSSSDIEPLDSPSGTEAQDSPLPEAPSEPVVLLGDRFEWCSNVEGVWTHYEQTVSNLRAVEARYVGVSEAYEAATDELDRAEIREALNEAERSYSESYGKNQEALTSAVYHLLNARRAYGDQPRDIAHQRAWSALLSADPELAALSAAVPEAVRGVPTTTAAPPLSDSTILIRVFDYKQVYSGPGDRVWNQAAEQAAHSVYSQADSSLIVEALLAAAPEAAKAEAQSDARQARDRTRAAYFVLIVRAGSVLEPFDAAAYEAADATDPSISSDSDFYVRAMQNLDPSGMIEGDNLFWAVLASRVRVIEAALPAAIDLARLTDDLRVAEAEAEWARQQQAEQALQDALAVAVASSDAYVAFKRSFEESCR